MSLAKPLLDVSQNLKKEGAQIENKVTPIPLPGSDPGDGIVAATYFSDHKATNTQCHVY
jgi:hypothetical protein